MDLKPLSLESWTAWEVAPVFMKQNPSARGAQLPPVQFYFGLGSNNLDHQILSTVFNAILHT